MKNNKPVTVFSCFHKLFSVFMSISLLSSIVASCALTLVTGIKSASASPLQEYSVKNTLHTANLLSVTQFQDQQVFPENANQAESTRPWDKHIGDLEMFVYGLLVSEYQALYEVFNGMITLPDGSEIYGIGFTDFDSYFESDEGVGFFSAGFIPLIGESDIPEEFIESGLEITDIEQMEIGISFVLAYDVEPFLQHCVIWDKYLQYGIDENGRITYIAEDYVRGHCNEKLGALYSFDEKRFVFDPNVGTYHYISGQSLYSPIDYAALEAEVDRILEEQDFNFSEAEVRTAVYTAQEAYTNYLLNLQEESFMGYPVKDLITLAEQLDPMELIRFTSEGHVIVNIADDIPNNAEGFTKWIIGIQIGITVICTGVSIIFPAFAPFAGAISMASSNVFSQILNENKGLSEVNWGKVAISALTGALIAWAIPTISGDLTYNLMLNGASEAASKLAGYSLQGISTGLVHGISETVTAILDGREIGEVWDTFLISAAQSAAISLVFSGAFEVLNPMIDSIVGSISANLIEAINKNPNGWLSRFANKIGELNVHQIHFDNEALDRFLTPRSVYESAKIASRELQIQTAFNQKMFHYLPNNQNFEYFDKNGQLLTKDQIDVNNLTFFIRPSENCSPELADYFSQRGITELPVVNGIVDFSDVSYYKIIPTAGISINRDINFRNFSNQLAEEWVRDPSKIPLQIRELLSDAEIENLTGTIIQRVISEGRITFHEGADGAIYLVDRILHKNITHAGGVFIAYLRETITAGIDYLQWLIYGVEPAVIEATVP